MCIKERKSNIAMEVKSNVISTCEGGTEKLRSSWEEVTSSMHAIRQKHLSHCTHYLQDLD